MKQETIPKNKITILRFSKFHDKWVFEYNSSKNAIIIYTSLDACHRRIRELRRNNPKRVYMIGRNYATCPSCKEITPVKLMDWIGICNNCLKAIWQEMNILYPLIVVK